MTHLSESPIHGNQRHIERKSRQAWVKEDKEVDTSNPGHLSENRIEA